MDTQGDLRVKAKVAFAVAGVCLAATPYLAVAELPAAQHGNANVVLACMAAGLSLLSFGIGLLDLHLARSAPVARPAVSPEDQAAARTAVLVLVGGQAVLMTGVGLVLLLRRHVPMSLLSFLCAALFGVVVAMTRKKSRSTTEPAPGE